MAGEKKFHVGIKALIENDEGKVLLMKTIGWKASPAHWDIPGGRVQESHSIDETLRREVEEETGITELANIEFFNAVISNIEIPLKDGDVVGLVLMIYKVQIPHGSIVRLSEEHAAYEWVNKAEAAERLSHKYPKEFTQLLLDDGAEDEHSQPLRGRR